MAPPWVAWVSSWYGSCTWPMTEAQIFYSLISGQTYHQLWVTRSVLVQCGRRDYTKVWVQGSGDPWGPSWKLSTILAFLHCSLSTECPYPSCWPALLLLILRDWLKCNFSVKNPLVFIILMIMTTLTTLYCEYLFTGYLWDLPKSRDQAWPQGT